MPPWLPTGSSAQEGQALLWIPQAQHSPQNRQGPLLSCTTHTHMYTSVHTQLCTHTYMWGLRCTRVHIRTCVHVCIHMCTCVNRCTYTSAHMCACKCVYASAHACVDRCTCVHCYTCVHICMCVHTHSAGIYVCTHAYTRVHTCTYAHTCAHIASPQVLQTRAESSSPTRLWATCEPPWHTDHLPHLGASLPAQNNPC